MSPYIFMEKNGMHIIDLNKTKVKLDQALLGLKKIAKSGGDYDVLDDDIYYSILPTSTQNSRNSLFSGLLPLEIQKKFPEFWRNDSDEC